ncbi:MAG: ABC transporter ATP-binding protein [Candidatus Latescibacteria bacterium]|nr:ABC transporter ATP-binding protein [Candidatus Latescibacterota bacterium]
MFGEEVFYSEEETTETKGQTKKLLKALLPYFMRFRARIITATIMLLVSTVLGLFGPILLRHAIDVDIKQGSIPGLIRTSLLYLTLQLVVYIIGYFQRINLALVGERAAALIKENLYKHIINLPIQFFDKNPVGQLLTRVDSDTEAIKNLFNTSAVVITQDLVLLVGMSVVMAIINVKLFLIIAVLLPPFIIAFWWFQKKVRPVYLQIRRKIAEINNFVNESTQNLAIIQAFNREDYSSDKMERLNQEKFAQEYKGMKLWYRIWYLVDFGEVLGLVFVLGIGGLWALKGLVTIGTLFLFASYITRLFMPLRGLSDQLNIMQRAFASAQRIFNIFESKTEPQGMSTTKPVPTAANDKITFQDLFFSYDKNDNWVLKDINFTIRPGEKIALVGMTGSGKTSIISLLLKFYHPQQGKILLDGADITTINNQMLRSQIGFVPQDIILFPSSVFDNLRLFDNSIPLSQVRAATEQIGIHNTIEKFPNGYDTDLIARGVNLSVGERQLLSFARALVRNPQILILDEATSSIDPYTESLIQDGLHKLLQNRTAIIIAHRLATIQMVDRIIVIHKGQIVEQGTHRELLKKQGYYYRLYRLQYLSQSKTANHINSINSTPVE